MKRQDLLGRVRARPAWVLVGVLLLVGLLGLFTDVFRSPRSVVRDAIRHAWNATETELRFVIDTRAPRDGSSTRYHHLNFRAGPGPLLRPADQLPRVQFPFTLTLERPGTIQIFRGQTVIVDGAEYIRIDELPVYGRFSELVQGRWLQVSDRREQPGRTLTAEEAQRVAGALLAPDVLPGIRRGSTEEVRNVNTRVYHLTFNEERLRAVLAELPQQVPDHSGLAAVARYIDGQLQQHRIDVARLWIRPRTHELVRIRFELVPREDANRTIDRLVVDATLLPRETEEDPQAPERAVRLRPETIQRILGR